MTDLEPRIAALAEHYATRVYPSTLRPNESLMVIITSDGERAYYINATGATVSLMGDPSGQTFDLTPHESIVVHVGTYLVGPTARQVAYVVRSGDPRDSAGMHWHEITT